MQLRPCCPPSRLFFSPHPFLQPLCLGWWVMAVPGHWSPPGLRNSVRPGWAPVSPSTKLDRTCPVIYRLWKGWFRTSWVCPGQEASPSQAPAEGTRLPHSQANHLGSWAASALHQHSTADKSAVTPACRVVACLYTSQGQQVRGWRCPASVTS